MGTVTDYAVHGLLIVRLRNAPKSVRDSVARELGPAQEAGTAAPDLTISFVDHLSPSGDLRLLGLNEAAFDEEHFYLLDSQGHRARIDLERLGQQSEIVCEAGMGHVPLLIPTVGLHLLRKGHVMLHASSFVYRGKGILATGWKKGGKTELLLPFMAAGADYIADEWTVIGGMPPRMYGVAAVARIWEWQLRYLPMYWARIGKRARLRLSLMRLYRRFYRALPGVGHVRRGPFSLLHRLSQEGGTSLLGVDQISPAALFGNHVHEGGAPLDRIFWAVLGEKGAGISVSPVQPEVIASRMVSSLAYERAALLTAYQQFRFAFPERTNRLIEIAREEELRLLTQAFAGKPAFEVRHPYPVPLPDLYRATARFC